MWNARRVSLTRLQWEEAPEPCNLPRVGAMMARLAVNSYLGTGALMAIERSRLRRCGRTP